MSTQAPGKVSEKSTEEAHGQGDTEGEDHEVAEPEHRGTRRCGQHREHRRRASQPV